MNSIVDSVLGVVKLRLFWIGLVCFAATLALAYCTGRRDGRASADRDRAEANARIIEKGADAAATASAERIEDMATSAAEQKELEDATAGCSSDADCRVRRGCAILRQQGRDTARIPACAGLGL